MGTSTGIALVWCVVPESLMETLEVVKSEVVSDAQACFPDRCILFEIDLLVFQGTPETFHKDVVVNPSSAVHADGDAFCFQDSGEPAGRELGALVRVEDLRSASLKGIRERFDAEVDLHCYGRSPGNDVPAEPIHDDNKVDETLLHPNIGYVSRPYLIRTINNYLPEQVWILLGPRVGLTQTLLGINSLDSHSVHEPTDPLAVHHMALTVQPSRHASGAIEWRPSELLVDQTHENLIPAVIPPGPIIQAGSGKPQKLTLPGNRDLRMIKINQLPPLISR
jgi:hypothetical protein